MAKPLGRRSSAGVVPSRFVERLEDRQLLSTSVFALTVDNRLVQFDVDNPAVTSNPLPVTGLPADTRIVGIDVRPADGQLYGLGENATIYRINPTTGAATAIGPAFAASLTGTGYDLDVDPVSDRIRVVTNGGTNALINPADGSVINQTALAYAAGDPRAGSPSNVSGIGYTNSFAGATQTTLYGIDTATDSLVFVGDANAADSTAGAGQVHTVGGLGVDVESSGVDVGNEAGGGVIYAAANLAGQSGTRLLRIDSATGAATSLGTIGTNLEISEIAVFPRAVQFQVSGVTVSEDAGSVTVTVTRVNGTSGTASVNFATQNGTAVAGTDYTATTGTINFADGEESKTIVVAIADDTAIEVDKTFNVVLSDPSAGTALVNPSTTVVTIADNETGAILIDDPSRPGRQVLLVRGGTGDDRITLSQSGRRVSATVNGVKTNFNNVPSVLVLGSDGADRIDIGKNVKVQAFVFAGNGNDRVTGNKANSVIVGGDGNDTITSASGAGRQILIGGNGADKITGGAKDDVLVAGNTNFDAFSDANLAALRDLSGAWTKSGGYKTKVNRLGQANGSSGATLTAATVFNDSAVDTLDGKGATDLFFTSSGDKVTKKARSETNRRV